MPDSMLLFLCWITLIKQLIDWGYELKSGDLNQVSVVQSYFAPTGQALFSRLDSYRDLIPTGSFFSIVIW